MNICAQNICLALALVASLILLYPNPANSGVCGVTNNSLDGRQIRGYKGAARLCNSAAGCSSSSGSQPHMCTAHELILWISLGNSVVPPNNIQGYWYATGVMSRDGYDNANNNPRDCGGFKNNDRLIMGMRWLGDSYGWAHCDSSAQIVCCD